MSKYLIDFTIDENIRINSGYSLLKLHPIGCELPRIEGGQFVNILITDAGKTFLRRPISVSNVDYERQLLWLLVKDAGDGTHRLCNACKGELFNILLPLGKGFSFPSNHDEKLLLVGGGVGVAPLLYWGKILKDNGYTPEFLLGARTVADLLLLDEFSRYGKVFVTTEDGSYGDRGFVTAHRVLASSVDRIYCCGPMPMMLAIAKIANSLGVYCEVSLENKMACGMGACLCCVENTVDGHECVCTSGPVFNINELKWQI